MPLTEAQRAEIAALRAQTVPTARPTVPALEAMLGTPLEVLDHGFVRVIDYMGDDAAIVQAARVSYGRGTRRVSEDAGLIRYLMRHRHSTPFEMCEIKYHVKLPIFIARQWIRHRTACLAGDSRLYFDLPGGRSDGGKFRRHPITIGKFFDMWQGGTRQTQAVKKKSPCLDRVDPDLTYTVPELARLVGRREESIRNLVREAGLRAEKVPVTDPRQPALRITGASWHEWASRTREQRIPIRERLNRMRLRMCDEASGEIEHTTVTDIWQTGEKPVYQVTLDNGHAIRMTKDHRCLTSAGWMSLEEAAGLRLRPDHGVTSWKDDVSFAVNGIPAYQEAEWLRARVAECLTHGEIGQLCDVSGHTIKKWADKLGIRYTREQFGRISSRKQQGRRRTVARRGPLSTESLENVRKARSGPASNFWKGGVARDAFHRDYEVVLWTRRMAPETHARNGFVCVICGGRNRLHAHHVDPIWNNPGRAMDPDNLTSLCRACHSALHASNLETAFRDECAEGTCVRGFFDRHPPLHRPLNKKKPRPKRLVRGFARIKKIEYAGIEMTYDLSVAGPYHNFVANGFVVHNSVNEYSARYSILDKEFYIPAPEHLAAQSASNRQGRGEVLAGDEAAEVLALLRDDASRNYDHYAAMLNETADGAPADPSRLGLARELARMNLTLNTYTQWYWKTDLHNLFHFLSLRADPHAQYEIRVYAEAMARTVDAWVPIAAAAFRDYRLGAATLSAGMLDVVKRKLAGETVTQPDSGLNRREWTELMGVLGQAE